MLGSNSSTYSNAEQDSIKFQRYTLTPIEDMIAQELGLKLINTYNESDTYFEFSPDTIKLASSKEKSETISLLKREGIITPNEAREYYNLQSKDNGDELIIQINTAPQTLVEEQMEASITNTNVESVTEVKEEEVLPKETEDNSEVEELKRAIQQLKSDIGRLKKK